MTDDMDDIPLREGDLIDGKYRVTRTLGVGGMGYVVEAYHEQLGQRVAIKGLLQGIQPRPEAIARFLREARAAVRIQNEHVARVTDVGSLPDGAAYMVMEYLDGVDLAQRTRGTGPLAAETAVDYVLQACEAIAEAHAIGIVHRDLKPANLFLTRRSDGSPLGKVLDFGISKVFEAGEPQRDITGTAVAMGSPQYMSREQMHSAKHVDVRTDIWALGTVLFELIAGCPAFDAETFAGLCAMIATQSPPALSSV